MSDPAAPPEPAVGTAPRPGGRSSSLVGAVGWFAVSYGLAVLGYLAISAISSRWLGPSQFGYFVIATTVSTGIGQFGLFGAHRAGLRDAAVMGDTTDDAALERLRSGARGVTVVTLPLTSLVAGLVLLLVVDAGSWGSRVFLAAVFALLVYFSGLQKLYSSYLRGLGEIRLASLLEGRSGGALVALAQAAFLALGWWLLSTTGLVGALVAATLGFLVPIVVVGVRVARRWRHVVLHSSMLRGLVESMRRNWRFAVNQLATYLGGTVEIWMAGLLLSAADTSYFTSAQRLALLLSIPLVSMQVVFAPVCARLLAAGEAERLERIIRSGATLAAAAAAVLWVPTLVAPRQVLEVVYGPEFGAGALVLLILSLGNAANVFSGLSGTVLTMSRNEGTAAAIQTGVMIARVVVGAAAALAFGLIGLAVSSAVLATVLYAVSWWKVRTLIGISTHATLRPSLAVLRQTKG